MPKILVQCSKGKSPSCQGFRIFGDKKIIRSPSDLARKEGCVEPIRAREVRLNASALSDSESFTILVSAPMIPDTPLSFFALIDCGSSHCFVDTAFVTKYKLSTSEIPPVRLHLLDGTSKTMLTQTTDIPIHFPSGEITPFMFYVTPLDSSCSAVLGLNWLTRYNPLIDWVLRSISFRPALLDSPVSTSPPANVPEQLPPPTSDLPESSVTPPTPSISVVSAAT